jgi:hypothetical protein
MAIAVGLSGCGGASDDDVAAAAPAGTLQLQSDALRVSEGSGSVVVVITRAGGSSGAVSATLSIVAGSASFGSDVTATTRMVVFADGDAATKIVTIPLLDDGEDEADEVFTAHLSAVSGGATLGSPASATITIADDDDVNILTHRVAGTVSGLSGTLALRNNGADELRIDGNGAFTFPIQISEGQPYAVTVSTQPAGQDCTVVHSSGTVGNADVIDVAVTCVGGSAPPPPPPTTGVFTGGPVKGLHYRTPSQSGLTDVAGTFIYIPGERVAFSIGGIELGSALGAAQINLFKLFGMTPPSTELALRTEINSPENITDFDRVANRAHLLFALDADHNGANGIDLGSWDAQLAGATLNFEAPMQRFDSKEFARFARLRGVAYKFPPELPLVHLYRSLDITVRAHAVNDVTKTSSAEDEGEYKQALQFDGEGRIERNATEYDNDHDGVTDTRVTRNFSYDAVGRQISEVVETDVNTEDGGRATRRSDTDTYDVAGNRTLHVHEDVNGTPVKRNTESDTYDAAGNLTVLVREDDDNADGTAESRSTSTRTYATGGDVITVVDEVDDDADNAPDSRSTETLTYVSAGNTLTTLREEEFTANSTVNRRTRGIYTYDAEKELQSVNTEVDDGADGSVNARTLNSFVDDAAGNFRTDKTEEDSAGGIADGEFDFVQTSTIVVDSAGNVLSSRFEDANGDGAASYRETTTTTYGSAENVLSVQREVDMGGDGMIDSVTITRFVYGDDGNMVSSTSETDGTVSSVYTYGSEILEDGVGYLLRGGGLSFLRHN